MSFYVKSYIHIATWIVNNCLVSLGAQLWRMLLNWQQGFENKVSECEITWWPRYCFLGSFYCYTVLCACGVDFVPIEHWKVAWKRVDGQMKEIIGDHLRLMQKHSVLYDSRLSNSYCEYDIDVRQCSSLVTNCRESGFQLLLSNVSEIFIC